MTPATSPPKLPKSPIYLPKSAILCHFIKKFYTLITQPLQFQRLRKAMIEPLDQRMAYSTANGKAIFPKPALWDKLMTVPLHARRFETTPAVVCVPDS